MRKILRSGGAFLLVAATVIGLSVGASGPAYAEPDFPSWDDVQAARQNEAATLQAIAEIEGLLAGLETAAADLGRVALLKAEEYTVARDALDAASAKAKKLEGQADSAAASAEKSSQRAGQLIAQLARTGGGDLTIGLLFSADAGDLLNQLGTMSRLSEQSSFIYRQAILDQNLAQSLTDQARVAEQLRGQLTVEAEAAMVAAEAAKQAAEERVAEQQAASDQLYAQLVLLKGATVSTEQGYLDGLAWEAAQEAVRNPPPPAPPVNPPPPAPNGSAVEGAIAFARAQLGDMYQWGGYGPDRWDCSGLTKAAYASVGVYIGTHSATNQYNTMANAGRLVPLSDMVAGDLLWYSNGGSTWGSKYHTALYIGNGQMIEAPYEGQPVRIRAVRYGDLVPYAGRPTP